MFTLLINDVQKTINHSKLVLFIFLFIFSFLFERYYSIQEHLMSLFSDNFVG